MNADKVFVILIHILGLVSMLGSIFIPVVTTEDLLGSWGLKIIGIILMCTAMILNRIIEINDKK